MLYRGQEKDWDLLPKIARKGYISRKILDREKTLMREFERLSYPFIDSEITHNDWNLLAIAQHHRLPTRLLDWSENPLIALWFSCNADRPNNVQTSLKNPRVVWAFGVEPDEVIDKKPEKGPYDQRVTRVFRPNHVTRTITVQSGWFTVHKYMTEKKSFLPLNRNSIYSKRLLKFTVSTEEIRHSLLSRLDKMGTNSFSLFPDVYGMSDYLEWKYFKKQ